ncbi:serine hydrolase domain-containing protein [Actinopolymorpha cephalotaxi]|nr:serine hydrolase [Actinopolymorpha cephalotaxi]NYH86310.1 CubicO group peptidase (beta-lactamase class C family) [Actinopolymorpha cephalotaxi]
MKLPAVAVLEGVERFGRAAAAQGLGVDGVHVYQEGRDPVERHWAADIRRDVFSVSKTFTSVAVGIAADEGLLKVDDPVLRHLPSLAAAASASVEAVTIRHLLTMTSGLGWRWPDPDADHPGDPAADFLSTKPAATPGTLFQYRGGSTYVLSRIIHACSGMDLRDYLVPRLFTPLGIANPQWHRCPLGYSLGAVGLFLRTAELARLGQTLLDGGRYQGRQLVSAEYVAALTTDTTSTDGHLATCGTEPHPQNATYGRHVWLCDRDGAWRMDGIYGQFCVVFPHHAACITVTSHYQGATTDILDTIWSEIVPTLYRH